MVQVLDFIGSTQESTSGSFCPCELSTLGQTNCTGERAMPCSCTISTHLGSDNHWKRTQQSVQSTRKVTNAKTDPKYLLWQFLYVVIQLSSHHLIYPLTTKVVRTLQMISQPVSSMFPCSPLPSGTLRTPGLSIPWGSIPTSSCLPCLLPPLTVPCKMVLARPDERETWPNHCSLHFF